MRGQIASFAACALVAVSVPWSSAEAAPITLTRTVAETGSTRPSAMVRSTFTASPGYDFTAQSYSSLSSITELVVTLTLFDADSAVGNLDHNKLTLGLDGIDTGILFNGFRDAFTDTLTITGAPSPTVLPSLLDALRADGRLVGNIFSTDHPSFNGLIAPQPSIPRCPSPAKRELERVARQSRPIRPAWIDTLLQRQHHEYHGDRSFSRSPHIAFVTNAPSSSYLRDYSDEFLNTLGIIPLTGYAGPLFVISWLGSAPSGASGDGRFELTTASPATPESLAAGFTASV